jgi:hypothetical protein
VHNRSVRNRGMGEIQMGIDPGAAKLGVAWKEGNDFLLECYDVTVWDGVKHKVDVRDYPEISKRLVTEWRSRLKRTNLIAAEHMQHPGRNIAVCEFTECLKQELRLRYPHIPLAHTRPQDVRDWIRQENEFAAKTKKRARATSGTSAAAEKKRYKQSKQESTDCIFFNDEEKIQRTFRRVEYSKKGKKSNTYMGDPKEAALLIAYADVHRDKVLTPHIPSEVRTVDYPRVISTTVTASHMSRGKLDRERKAKLGVLLRELRKLHKLMQKEWMT